MFFEEFMSSRQFTTEEQERRRVQDYYSPGMIDKQDREAYVTWLEEQLANTRKNAVW